LNYPITGGKWLREGKLEANGQEVQVLPAEGEDVNPGQPLKQYWVLVKGLPLKLSTIQHVQKCIKKVGDVLEVDWYNDNWLDNRWIRVKVALLGISFLPSPQTRFLTKQRMKAEFHTMTFEPKVGGINSNIILTIKIRHEYLKLRNWRNKCNRKCSLI
jgi:hypothetical protein